MNTYQIYTDSAADMPARYYRDYDIRIVPMDYSVNGVCKTFLSDVPEHDQLCEEICGFLREGADVHTSQVTPYRFVEYWTPVLKEGYDILYIAFSSALSTTCDNAHTAAAELREDFPERRIVVIDSLSATAAQGLLAVTAAMNRQQGMDLDANTAWLREHVLQMSLRFSVGDLEYLHKGGRLPGAVALIGGKLNLKPLFVIDNDGKLKISGTARGLNSAFKNLIKGFTAEYGVPSVPKLVFVCHSAQYEKADRLAEQLREALGSDVTVETVCESPVIGVHSGPDFYAIAGWGESRLGK